MRNRHVAVAAGALLSLVVAAALFSRYGIDGALARDEAVYVRPDVAVRDPEPPRADRALCAPQRAAAARG